MNCEFLIEISISAGSPLCFESPVRDGGYEVWGHRLHVRLSVCICLFGFFVFVFVVWNFVCLGSSYFCNYLLKKGRGKDKNFSNLGRELGWNVFQIKLYFLQIVMLRKWEGDIMKRRTSVGEGDILNDIFRKMLYLL